MPASDNISKYRRQHVWRNPYYIMKNKKEKKKKTYRRNFPSTIHLSLLNVDIPSIVLSISLKQTFSIMLQNKNLQKIYFCKENFKITFTQ